MPVPTENTHTHTRAHIHTLELSWKFDAGDFIFYLYAFYQLARILPFEPKMSEMKADDLNCITTSVFVIKMALFFYLCLPLATRSPQAHFVHSCVKSRRTLVTKLEAYTAKI